jgi:flagellar basal body-associated protein FliL
MPPIAPNQHKKIHVRIMAIIVLLVAGAGAYFLMIHKQQQRDRFLEKQQAILNRLGESSASIPRLSPSAQANLLSKQTNTNQPSSETVTDTLTSGLPK